MCGIAGFFVLPGHRVPADWLRASADRLGHRGPDDRGFLLWDGAEAIERGRDLPAGMAARAGFVHRRLSILDLGEGGWQPMSTADGSISITYNGEIYNFVELREELRRLGRVFRSQSDTEVLLAGYAEWGMAVLHRLVGMFACAILDLRRRKLILVRDHFGIKPLYYVETGLGLAFASEIGPLLAIQGVGRRCDVQSLYRYLRFGLCDHGGATMFQDVRQLPAAHAIEIDLDRPAGGAMPRRYWSLPARNRAEISREAAADRLRDLFVESVGLHLRSDVPVGAALSGGIDSSSIVMAMREIGGARMDLHSFTYVADDPAIEEEGYADLVGAAAGATMHKIRLRPEELVADLDHLIRTQQQPFGSTSIYAQHRVFRKASEVGIKVMLDGQGADEMLAGYLSYLPAHTISLARSAQFRGAAVALSRGRRSLGGGWGYHLSRIAAGLVPPSLLTGAFTARSALFAGPRWLDLGWFRERGVPYSSGINPAAAGSLDGALRTTFAETSLPALLRYEDMNSMAHSIESRVPFLTPALVEFVFSLPTAYLIDAEGTTKSVFREAMRGLVPDGILDRRDKIGFQTPERAWFGTVRPAFEAILSGGTLARLPFLNAPNLTSEFSRALSGERPFDWRIWRWINIIRWFELFEVDHV